jgi:hypothetical protein
MSKLSWEAAELMYMQANEEKIELIQEILDMLILKNTRQRFLACLCHFPKASNIPAMA